MGLEFGCVERNRPPSCFRSKALLPQNRALLHSETGLFFCFFAGISPAICFYPGRGRHCGWIGGLRLDGNSRIAALARIICADLRPASPDHRGRLPNIKARPAALGTSRRHFGISDCRWPIQPTYFRCGCWTLGWTEFHNQNFALLQLTISWPNPSPTSKMCRSSRCSTTSKSWLSRQEGSLSWSSWSPRRCSLPFHSSWFRSPLRCLPSGNWELRITSGVRPRFPPSREWRGICATRLCPTTPLPPICSW